jgi:hypothetical protein
MDALDHSDLTAAGKYAALEAAAGFGNEVIFGNAEPVRRLKRSLKHLKLSKLQQRAVLRVAGRWICGEWPSFSLVMRSAANCCKPRMKEGLHEGGAVPLHENG